MVYWLIRIVYEESMVSDIGSACLGEIGYKSRWWSRCNHLCEKLARELVDLLWLRNIGKEGMAMFGLESDRDVWKSINVERIKEYGRIWWMNDFGINGREQEYLKVKSTTRDRLMIRGGCQLVRGLKGMEWKYADDLCEYGTKETEIHVFFRVLIR